MMGLLRRALCLGLGSVFVAAAIEVGQLCQRAIPRPSLILWASLALTSLVSLGLLALGLGPETWWCRLRTRWLAVRKSATETQLAEDSAATRWVGCSLIILSLLTYGALVNLLLPRNQQIDANDQGAYLGTAVEVRQDGGPAVLLKQLLRGEFREANRHPLFIGLLSIAPTFENGKRMSATIGAICLIVFAWLVSRKFGSLAGGIFSVLLATNFAFLHSSVLVTCEGLLILWTGLTWIGSVSAVTRRDTSDGRSPRREFPWGTGRTAWLAALLGFAYLTKATALALFAGWWLWLAVASPKCIAPPPVRTAWSWSTVLQRVRERKVILGVALVVWIVVTSPLWLRNLQRFGSPFYNVNSLLLFVDAYEAPDDLAQRITVGEAARTYLKSHSFTDLLRREGSGLAWEAFIIGRALGPAPLDDSRILIGAVLLPLVLVDVIAGSCSRLTIVWTVLLWLLFAWYVPIAAGERFILPLLIPLLTHAACGAARLLNRFHWNDSRTAMAIVAIAGALYCTATLVATSAMSRT